MAFYKTFIMNQTPKLLLSFCCVALL